MSNYGDIYLSRQTIVRILTATTCFLLTASIAGQITKYVLGHDQAFGFVRLFYVDSEGNIPTFFSSFLFLLSSILLALITALKMKSQDPYSRHWMMLSLTFLYMAVDEAAGIHELLHEPGKWLLGAYAGGIFTYAWVIFGIAIIMAFAFSYLKFYIHLASQDKKRFFIAAAIFLGGAIGMELWGSYYDGLHGRNNVPYAMLTTVEEGLEMAGIIIFINALLHYVIDHYDIRLHVEHF